jgi:hypothetical protein
MSERMRLAMLCTRDGHDAAKGWARSALQVYRQSLDNPTHFAAHADWKARFERSMRELATFVEHGNEDTSEVIHDK